MDKKRLIRWGVRRKTVQVEGALHEKGRPRRDLASLASVAELPGIRDDVKREVGRSCIMQGLPEHNKEFCLELPIHWGAIT